MTEKKLRVAAVMNGDIYGESWARTKYGHLFDALGRRVNLVEVLDVSLSGFERLLNGLMVFHPNRHQWKQRFYKNLPAFRMRSRRANRRLQAMAGEIDIVFQVGVLFDAVWRPLPMPSVIYTDYTAYLSGQKPDAGRSPFSEAQRKQWIALEYQAMCRAAHICTRGNFVRRSLIADQGLPADGITAVGGGINYAAFPEQPPRKAENSAKVVLFIGKDFYRKGGDVLLKAFAKARQVVPDARLQLVTDGPVDETLLRENVEIVPPSWDRERISKLYQDADLFVLPSRLETWGDVLLEAMSFGLPCIGVSGEAMDEIIDDQQTGIVVPPNDVNALAQAMSTLLKDRQLRHRLGLNGRRKAEIDYTWDHVVNKLIPIFSASL